LYGYSAITGNADIRSSTFIRSSFIKGNARICNCCAISRSTIGGDAVIGRSDINIGISFATICGNALIEKEDDYLIIGPLKSLKYGQFFTFFKSKLGRGFGYGGTFIEVSADGEHAYKPLGYFFDDKIDDDDGTVEKKFLFLKV
jgi:NDP-sugar pyrophosphorylase family protein